MAKVSLKPGATLAPLPAVMVSCGKVEDGTENIITIAWTGIINSDPPCTYVSVRPGRASHDIIENSGVFVINLVPESLAFAMDWCGCVSRRKEYKFGEKHFGSGSDAVSFTLTPEKAENVDCVAIKESPVQLECRIFDKKSLGSHDMYMAQIVGLRVDESIINGEGRITMEKLGLVSLIHGSYYAAKSTRIGRMGYAVMKPDTKKRLSAQQRAKYNIGKQGKEKLDRG